MPGRRAPFHARRHRCPSLAPSGVSATPPDLTSDEWAAAAGTWAGPASSQCPVPAVILMASLPARPCAAGCRSRPQSRALPAWWRAAAVRAVAARAWRGVPPAGGSGRRLVWIRRRAARAGAPGGGAQGRRRAPRPGRRRRWPCPNGGAPTTTRGTAPSSLCGRLAAPFLAPAARRGAQRRHARAGHACLDTVHPFVPAGVHVRLKLPLWRFRHAARPGVGRMGRRGWHQSGRTGSPVVLYPRGYLDDVPAGQPVELVHAPQGVVCRGKVALADVVARHSGPGRHTPCSRALWPLCARRPPCRSRRRRH